MRLIWSTKTNKNKRLRNWIVINIPTLRAQNHRQSTYIQKPKRFRIVLWRQTTRRIGNSECVRLALLDTSRLRRPVWLALSRTVCVFRTRIRCFIRPANRETIYLALYLPPGVWYQMRGVAHFCAILNVVWLTVDGVIPIVKELSIYWKDSYMFN